MPTAFLLVGSCRPYNARGFLPLSGCAREGQLVSSEGSVTQWLAQLQAGDATAQLGRVPRTVKRWLPRIRQIGEKELHS
jgi:hypothetical protein